MDGKMMVKSMSLDVAWLGISALQIYGEIFNPKIGYRRVYRIITPPNRGNGRIGNFRFILRNIISN